MKTGDEFSRNVCTLPKRLNKYRSLKEIGMCMCFHSKLRRDVKIRYVGSNRGSELNLCITTVGE